MSATKPLRLSLSVYLAGALLGISGTATAQPLDMVQGVELQPLAAQVRRVLEATEYLGTPLSAEEKQKLDEAFRLDDKTASVAAIQRILDPHCLMAVHINPESRVKVAAGPAQPILVEHGWRQFLIKVHNEAGVTAGLRVLSPNARSVHNSPWQQTDSDKAFRRNASLDSSTSELDRWLDVGMFNRQPLRPELGGLPLEYRIIQLYSRDAGRREAKLAFDVGQGTQDLGFRNEADLLFTCLPAREVTLRIRDERDRPTTARLIIRDPAGRVYPSQAKRLAPDFAFHPQIYRRDGAVEKLPPGEYIVEYTRGPEYLTKTSRMQVGGEPTTWTLNLERWIDPSQFGWWSGDHHIHAAGCAHYTVPSKGVHAADMILHCLGEDLKVGCNLTWGPCFDYQKQFFTGKDDPVSSYPYLLHYDIEVSGFGSHQSGHLCLLRLTEQIYPGGDSSDHWPTLCLNTLRWAKRQGAVVGPAHSGWGLEVETDALPNYVVPPYNGIGANEYIVDVTHQVPGPDGKPVRAVDFMSAVDTPYVWELNMWYHTLNVGFRTRISGETDFPCIYGERVGLGRSYVKLDGPLTYAEWCEGIRQGRNYVGDGFSHLLGFQAAQWPDTNDRTAATVVHLGENGSEMNLRQPGEVQFTLKAAAWLDPEPASDIRNRPYTAKPYWHIERARIGEGREVPVELVVNGLPVARQTITADGSWRDLHFRIPIEQSSWVAARILPSSHTNPIWVVVDDHPVRASRRSAEWCLRGVDQCWSQKERFIKPEEMDGAQKAYDHARQTYRRLIAESNSP